MSTTETVTILLLLEAVDKASGIVGKITGAFSTLGETLSAAADKAARSAEEIDAANVKAEASAAAYSEAVSLQTAAQEKLAAATKAAQEAQAQSVEWTQMQKEAEAELAAATRALTEEEEFSYQVIRDSAAQAAESVRASVTAQVEALDALKVAEAEVATRSKEMAEAQKAASTETGLGAASLSALKATATVTAVGVGALGFVSAKAAANFQSMTAVLATSGGEMDKTGALLEKARQGILNIAQSTGTATDQLTKGLYMIGSAGFDAAHGGLDILTAAAQGAKAENADLGVVANALTTVMLDYGKSVGSPTQAMDQLIAVVQHGKTTTQELAASLANVLPIASSAGLSFSQVGGAMATMTAQGMSAQQASQDLANTMRAMMNPNNVAIQEMQQLGIDSNKLSQNLGKNGLTGTLQTLMQAIAAHTKNGQVMLSMYYNSASAAKDLKDMMAGMTPQMQSLANAFLSGSVTAKDFRNDLYALPPIQRNMMMQFETLSNKANGFNQLLKTGNPDAQTFNAALQKLTGGATGLNTALLLSSQHGQLFEKNVKAIDAASKSTSKNVEGWDIIQGNFNQKLAELKQTAEVAAIRLGTALLPVITKLLDVVIRIIEPIGNWISKHQKLAAVILGVVGALSGLLVIVLSAVKIFKMVQEAIKAISVAMEFLESNPIILIITAIAVVALLIITHWSTVKRWLEDFWKWLTSAAKSAGDFFVRIWRDVVGFLKTVWAGIEDAWNSTGGKAIAWISSEWDKVTGPITDEWNHIVSDLQSIWGSLVTIWNATGGKLVSLISRHWSEIKADVQQVWSFISGIIKGYLQIVVGEIKGAWDMVQGIFHVYWDIISGTVKAAWDVISGIVKGAIDFVVGILKAGWDVVVGSLKQAWNVATTVINTALDFIKDILKLFADLVTGKWSKLWGDVEKIFQDLWNNISSFFVKTYKNLVSTVGKFVKDIGSGFINGIEAAISGIGKALNDVKNTVVNAFKDAIHWLEEAGKNILRGFINGLKSMWNDVKGFFGDLTSSLTSWKGPPSRDKVLLVANGQLIMQGLITGIDSQVNTLRQKLEQVTSTVAASVNPTINMAGLGTTATALNRPTANTYTNYVDLRGSQVIGNSGIDQLANKIGSRLATHTFPASGTFLRMG